jgi:O-methyltransferase
VECGCYKGITAQILMDVVDLKDREFFLYDLFDHDASMPHHAMTEHSSGLFAEVQTRFAGRSNVRVIQGAVPDSFEQGLPEKVCFAHIDMNNAAAEIGALDALESRLVPGAMIVLDDFGALPYRAQHVAETKWFAERGVPVLELPTSQGLAIW